jgi:maltooligosyltrehalose trehalohydrolase
MLLDFYKELIRMRKQMPALKTLTKQPGNAYAIDHQWVLVMQRRADDDSTVAAFNFSDDHIRAAINLESGTWRKLLDSSDARWLGPGSDIPLEICSRGEVELCLAPHSVCLLNKASTADAPG